MIRAGRLGKVTSAVITIGGAPSSQPLPVKPIPQGLNWDKWLGQAPQADYVAGPSKNSEQQFPDSRSHITYRWWYEYSGGKLTDWGAHHVDIATWGMGKTDTGPVSLNPVMVKHPVELKDGYPVDSARYNTATEFHITAVFADGMELTLRHDTDNGILFEGTAGRIFVNRGRLSGKPVDDLKSNPLPAGALEEIYGRPLTDHVENFFQAVADRKPAVSDPCSHHRALSTCHLAGIAARLGRPIQWDPTNERVIGDKQAQSFVRRDKRTGFEIET